MDTGIEKAVGLVINSMRENLGDQLTIDDMARTAMFSKFHFSRLFQRATGLSPGRFLSAMRLQRAKDLLVSTSLNVTDISHRVGYTSVGTFSSRFSSSVGISPTTYRRLRGFVPRILVDADDSQEPRSASVRGHVMGALTVPPSMIYIGLFPDRLPQGRPVSCTVLTRPGPYVLRDVPRGTWHLLVHSRPVDFACDGPATQGDPRLQVGTAGPINIGPDSDIRSDVRLRPMRPFDPPVLLALPGGRDGVPGGEWDISGARFRRHDRVA